MPAAAIFVRYSSATEPSLSPELLADRVHLPAQQILALLFLRARLHLLANALANLQLRQPVLLQPQGEAQPFDHVQGLEQLQLLFDVDVRGVARRVRQGARMGDGADEGTDPAVVAAELEYLLDHRAVLALEVARHVRGWRRVRTFLDFQAQDSVSPGLPHAGHTPVQRHERDHATSAEGDALGHFGDDTHLGVARPALRDQEHARVAADIRWERDRHAREHHGVVQGNNPEECHTSKIGRILDDVNHW